MPTYEYLCKTCGNAWEATQRITENALTECPKCHEQTAERQISAGNFILKGGGWYSDLYSSTPKKTESKGDAPKADAKPDAPKADAPKTETKTETKAPATPATTPKKE